MIQFKLLTETAQVPGYQTPGAAGMDVYSDETLFLSPGQRHSFCTGVACALPSDCVGLIWPRSGMALRNGIDVLGGVIDSDYRGEIRVILVNKGVSPLQIKRGDRIAQLLVQQVKHCDVAVVDQLDDTERGDNGFGSTG